MWIVWSEFERWLAQGVPGLDLAQVAPMTWLLVGVAALLVVVLLALLWRFWRILRRLRAENKEGEKLSLVARGELPLYCFRRDGRPGDPLNVRMIASPAQLGSAFAEAGWYRADEITLVTSLRITIDSVLARSYSTAPVSNLFLYGRRQDFAFERPGPNVRQRDHVRFWRAKLPASDGRPVWIGGATRDDKVELSRTNHLPTHGIAPDVDDERTLIADDLIATGWVVAERSVPDFPGPTQTKNATGDAYHTDGQAILLTLARTQPVPLLPQLIREPGAGLVRATARRLRRNLPQQGRELAHEWQQRRAHARMQKPTNGSANG